MRKHTRPFKFQDSECSFFSLGFAAKTDLEVHLAQDHDYPLCLELHTERRKLLSEEELKAILIDAIQENELSMIREGADAVRKFILELLLSAYRARASDAMIKHLLGEISPNVLRVGDQDRNVQICTEILMESVENGNYDGFRGPFFKQWLRVSPQVSFTLRFLGRTRRAELLETVTSTLHEGDRPGTVSLLRVLLPAVIPSRSDTQA